MATGTQFLALLDMLREDLGRSTNVGVGVDDLPSLKRSINRAYALLLGDNDWPHIRHLPNRIPLSSGQRLYDIPAHIDPQKIIEIICWLAPNLPIPLDRGISYHEYSAIDSEAGQTSDPAQKWDLRFNGTATQIEIWPIPSSDSMTLQFTGRYRLPKLVDDDDVCYLDDELVVLGAAYRTLKRQKSDDADECLADFNKRLIDMRAGNGPSRTVVLGGNGEMSARMKPRVSVRR